MPTPFHVELVTPERVLFAGDAEEVSMRTDTGEIAFLARHEDFIGASDITVVSIHTASTTSTQTEGHGEEDGAALRAAVHGGFVRVDEEGVVILAGVAELASEIDVERARAALARAEEAMASTDRSSLPEDEGKEPEALVSGGASAALLAADAPEVAARRARMRLEAAGAST